MATIAGVPTGLSRPWHVAALGWSARLLVAVTWVSAAIFGAYIIAFFGGTAFGGAAARWNESLPELHDVRSPVATLAIGAHFLTGGILLLLGPIQLIGAVRRRVPALHRWLGRLYLLSAAFAGLGGLGFILAKGTIGGLPMDLGFGLYGSLMIAAAWRTYVHARAGAYETHRAWAIRLFALTVGSWLYRMEYGLWFLAAGGTGHNATFTGWFDAIMVFFFYVPNLLVAELFIRTRRRAPAMSRDVPSAIVMAGASIFVVLATWVFVTNFWGPAVISAFTGEPTAQ